MRRRSWILLFALPVFLFSLFTSTPTLAAEEAAMRVLRDATGRELNIPQRLERVICSGPGSLRLLTYLQAQRLAVAVDDMETRRTMFDARPYALANPWFKTLPTFGEFRGHDNPELILTLDPQPQVIFKTYPEMGHDPIELQAKTGIPVVVLDYGDLGGKRAKFYEALRIMGEAVGKAERAEEVIKLFDNRIADLKRRTADIPEDQRRTAFIGGVASKGPHGFQSTEPGYPPFEFVAARNLARGDATGKALLHADIAKEQIVAWNPDFLFLDLSTMQMGDGAGGLHELKTDPAYRALTAVRGGKVYGLLPYNWYSRNYGSILANAYYIGKLLSPERFEDVDPAKEADAIYEALVGAPVFEQMNEAFGKLVYQPIPLE